ncbi:hypothetical protein EVG20_g2978 [Dentipellis fragilis]|uniref:Uncharacterized protein n=1 Tax=Dentipellis fragilis TaxID=205917 RepID=A0A4Y9Z7R1_9AGAM|nr:hypothetical protein EVG20_g2978 [Dentipellis fragilis]
MSTIAHSILWQRSIQNCLMATRLEVCIGNALSRILGGRISFYEETARALRSNDCDGYLGTCMRRADRIEGYAIDPFEGDSSERPPFSFVYHPPTLNSTTTLHPAKTMSHPAPRRAARGRPYRGRGNGRGGAPTNNTPGPAAATLDRAPGGICNFYWATGACNRGFDCSFKHQAKPTVIEQSAASPSVEGAPDFFSAEGLAMNNGSIRSSQHTLKPSEAHNHLKPFLRDNYIFDGPSRIEGFVRIFASVNGRNASWVRASSLVQLHALNLLSTCVRTLKVPRLAFLDTIVRGNAILRIGDVLHFTPVSTTVNPHSPVLSFQRGYFPILEYLSSGMVLKSTMHHNINALYTLVENNYDAIHDTISSCLNLMVVERSWEDLTPGLPSFRQSTLDGVVLFKALSTLLSQYFARFKSAIRNHPQLLNLVEELASCFGVWSEAVTASSPTFKDPITSSAPEVQKLTINQIRDDVERLQTIVRRESGVADRQRRPAKNSRVTAEQRQQALVSQLEQTYDPPGALREGGHPRHDNDHAEIALIRIAPTHDELMCPLPPYLPFFLPDAPHHLPKNSIERHLDIQFRLLREDFMSPIRQSLSVLHNDLDIIWRVPNRRKRQSTKLEDVVEKGGGAYRTSGINSVFFQVYNNVHFAPVEAARRSFTIGLRVGTPPGPAKEPNVKKRSEYWEHGKRLQSGSLIALVLVSPNKSQIFLGTITSMASDIAQSAKANADEIQLRVSFFDAEVELLALRREKISVENTGTFALLVDNGVMYESVKPFLETLQTVEPTSIPFSRYISAGESLKSVSILPPRYATAPRFTFKLQCLARKGERIPNLDVRSPDSVLIARRELQRASDLDTSQVEAVVDTLTREVSLIQGPPGTGKSHTGKKLLGVLLASKVKPIVLIAYTNHALDHMLLSVLDDHITDRLVRLGSRTTDDRIAEFNLIKLEQMAGATDLDRSIRREYAVMKKIEEDMRKVMDSIQLPQLSWETLEQFLHIHYPDHADRLTSPPFWISTLFEQITAEEAVNGEWIQAGPKKKEDKNPDLLTGIYGFWRRARDIEFLQAPVITQAPVEAPAPVGAPIQILKKSDASPEDMDRGIAEEEGEEGKEEKDKKDEEKETPDPRTAFFSALGFAGHTPPVPSSSRSSQSLQGIPNVWSMSLEERRRLALVWEDEIRSMAYASNLSEFETLRERYKEACRTYNDVKDEARRRLLSKTDLIGCTTTGAAKLVSLLTTIGPKVLMVEEAGQVLEAHIIASLLSISYALETRSNCARLWRHTLPAMSMDSERGRELFKFDRSLMERLASNGMPMSQIDVQRRMRPTISHFPRTILYPKLQDHAVVQNYPPVQGVEKDVFFFSHTHPENGEADSVSKFNKFEVRDIDDVFYYGVLNIEQVEMIRDLVLYFLKQGPYNGPGDIAVLCAYLGQLQKVRAALRDLKIAVAIDDRDEDALARRGEEDLSGFDQVLVSKHASIRLGTVDTFQGEEAKIVIVSLVRNSGTFEGGSSIGFLKSINRINVALSRAKHGLYVLGNSANLVQNATWAKVIREMEDRDQLGYGLPIVCARHPDQKRTITKAGQLPLVSPEGGCLNPCEFRMGCGHNCQSVHEMRPALSSYLVPPRASMSEEVLRVLRGLLVPDLRRKVTMRSRHTISTMIIRPPPRPREKSSAHITRAIHASETYTADINAGSIAPKTMNVMQNAPKHVGNVVRTMNARYLAGGRAHLAWNPAYGNAPINHAPFSAVLFAQGFHVMCRVAKSSNAGIVVLPVRSSHFLVGNRGTDYAVVVCGEPCEKQKCVICLSDEQKTAVADFIMQRTLAELDLSSDDVSEHTITLECGHIFTVETLDGHTHMADYYELDAMGKFTATKAPPINYQEPPSCPTCRGSISALRYGRVMKRANLDILEQNVASTMSSTLEDISSEVQVLSSNAKAIQEEAKKLKRGVECKSEEDFAILLRGREDRFGRDDEPLPHRFLLQHSMMSVHGLAKDEAKAWNALVRGILRAYKKVEDVARTRGPHVQAYHAALATLYRLELDAIAADPSIVTNAPEPLAMDGVNRKIGQPPHKADTRFQVEAYFLSLELRFMLAQMAESRIEGLPDVSTDTSIKHHRHLWLSFTDFIYTSCVKDAEKALAIAQKSSASRLAARGTVYVIRSELEEFRFSMLANMKEMAREGHLDAEQRSELIAETKAKRADAEATIKRAETSYIRSQQSSSMSQLKELRQWFASNCRARVDKFAQAYDELAEHIRTNTAYQPLSLQEKMDIVKAFGFSHRGHFYTCANGHAFVITECGGAMESATCPECGAPIGGSNHSLHASNNRATEFEDLARGQGSEAAPWPWARGA